MNNLSKKNSKPQKGQKKSKSIEKEKSENESNTDSENSESEYVRVRLPRQGEILGIVTQILGADRIKVRCMDKKDRVVRIPGKHRKRLWCRQNDIVSVMPWYGLQEDTRGDLVYRYNKNQANWLEEKGYIVLD